MMEKGWLMPSFFVVESFSEPVLYLNLFSMLQRVKNYLECVLVSVEELVQQEYLLRMIVNNYKFVFSIEIGNLFQIDLE